MYDTDATAKERAYQSIQAQAASYPKGVVGGSYGLQGAGTNLAPPPKPTVTVEIINQMEITNSMLRDVITSQRNLLDRLHGPRPENPCTNDCKTTNGGILGTIEERLNWLRNSAQEILENQRTLDRLA